MPIHPNDRLTQRPSTDLHNDGGKAEPVKQAPVGSVPGGTARLVGRQDRKAEKPTGAS